MADIKQRKIKFYGWKPDFPDHRDLKFSPQRDSYPIHTVMLTDKYNFSKPYNQGELGSCTGNGIAFQVQFDLMNKALVANPNAKVYMPSRLFIYWWERYIEHSLNEDSGAQIRDGIKAVAAKGVCDEDKWPYDIKTFTHHPTDDMLKEANKFQALEYKRSDNSQTGNLVAALDHGFPIVFGFTVFESFESTEVATTGIVPMPKDDEAILGGHCCVIVGYNAENDYFLVRNSWGTDWGIDGYFKMPGNYITDTNLASDFWIITKIEHPV